MASQEATETLEDLLAREHQQIEEASLSIPHTFSACTYHLGYIRQPVYLCKTCNTPRGMCAACSVACHHDHEQVELFPKRAFRCDCPTQAYSHPCSLIRSDPKPINDRNEYNQNFQGPGQFCRCGRDYDPYTETETMIQCLACEDWFHEGCLNLRSQNSGEESKSVEIEKDVPEDDNDDADDNSDIDPSRPSPRLPASEYDSLVCRDCVLKIPILKTLAGTQGHMMIISKSAGLSSQEERTWEVIGKLLVTRKSTPTPSELAQEPDENSVKRKQPDSVDVTDETQPRSSKQLKLEDGKGESPCHLPSPNEIAQKILDPKKTDPVSESLQEYSGAGDVFLGTDFRERWCKCSRCHAGLCKYPYLLQEEETYEPPEDPDAKLSFEELGLRALNMLPRDRALDGIVAYNNFRDELLAYLRPFAQSGTAVSKDDIQKFFNEKQEARAAAARAMR